ncbi:MAG: inositol monophosphatase family protein [Microthrixaceae bacterium]
MADISTTQALAHQLAEVGREVRDLLRGTTLHGAQSESDRQVVRTEGGDDVYGVDARAEEVLIAALIRRCGERWPGLLIIEGFDEPVSIGDSDRSGGEPWTYLADPVDGTRGYLAGLHSAWVLLGAGRSAKVLEDLEVGAAIEIPTARAGVAMVAFADSYGFLNVQEDMLKTQQVSVQRNLLPTQLADLDRSFVTVVRLLPGGHQAIGAWADELLAGLEVYDDLYPCSGGQLMAVAAGSASAVLDPRPLLHPDGFHTHPYDLAALVVARAAGVIVESLPPGQLLFPIDTSTPVAWAAYANESIATQLRSRLPHLST